MLIQVAYLVLQDIGLEQRTDTGYRDRVWKIQNRNALTEHVRVLACPIRYVEPVYRAQGDALSGDSHREGGNLRKNFERTGYALHLLDHIADRVANVREDFRDVLPDVWGYRAASVSFCNHAQLMGKSERRRHGDTELVEEKVT